MSPAGALDDPETFFLVTPVMDGCAFSQQTSFSAALMDQGLFFR